jgi:hypothetical protein
MIFVILDWISFLTYLNLFGIKDFFCCCFLLHEGMCELKAVLMHAKIAHIQIKYLLTYLFVRHSLLIVFLNVFSYYLRYTSSTYNEYENQIYEKKIEENFF